MCKRSMTVYAMYTVYVHHKGTLHTWSIDFGLGVTQDKWINCWNSITELPFGPGFTVPCVGFLISQRRCLLRIRWIAELTQDKWIN